MLMFCIMMMAMMMTMIMMIEAANMYTSIHTPCELFRGFSVFVSLIVMMMWGLQVYILCVNSSGAFAAKTDDKAA